MFFEQMHPTWQQALSDCKPMLDSIEAKVLEREGRSVPPTDQIMRVFAKPLDEIRVLIVGQDPYPTAGHAVGLAFAVDKGISPLPRSLKNVMIELRDDLGKNIEATGDLSKWSERGVFLLNRHLTTDLSAPGAHSDLGWDKFTDRVIQVLNRKLGRNLVAILWGAQASQLAPALCDCNVLISAHPSPLSARKGFFGSKPFSKANRALADAGQPPIDWSC